MSENQAARLAVICPGCERPSACRVAGAVEVAPDYGEDIRWPFPARLSLLVCQHCGDVALVMQEDYGRGFRPDDLYRLWPAQERPLSPHIPEKLRAGHTEARACFTAKAYRATVVMVRRTLEGVCADYGVPKGSLQQRLTALNEKGVVESRLLSWAHDLRELGNVGAHYDDREVRRQDAEDALEFAEALLDYVYVLSAKFAQFQKRRAAAP